MSSNKGTSSMAPRSERLTSNKGFRGACSHGFLIVVCVMLAVSMVLLAVMRYDKSSKALSKYKGPSLEVYGAQYDELETYEELHDRRLMGLYPQEFRFWLNKERIDDDGNSKVENTFSYRFLGDDNNGRSTSSYLNASVKIALTGTRGDAVDYRITPKSSREAKKWNASITIPKQRDLEHPVGTWYLMATSPQQEWAHTTWLTVREDGTGEFGSIDKNAASATAAERAEATHPCTVTCGKVSNGYWLVARYEGGTYVLTATER